MSLYIYTYIYIANMPAFLYPHHFFALCEPREPDILTTNLQLSAAAAAAWPHALQCFLAQRDRNMVTYNASLKALGALAGESSDDK